MIAQTLPQLVTEQKKCKHHVHLLLFAVTDTDDGSNLEEKGFIRLLMLERLLLIMVREFTAVGARDTERLQLIMVGEFGAL